MPTRVGSAWCPSLDDTNAAGRFNGIHRFFWASVRLAVGTTDTTRRLPATHRYSLFFAPCPIFPAEQNARQAAWGRTAVPAQVAAATRAKTRQSHSLYLGRLRAIAMRLKGGYLGQAAGVTAALKGRRKPSAEHFFLYLWADHFRRQAQHI